MNPDSVRTNARDTARWPAHNKSAARAVLDDPFAGEVVKNACRLILGGMKRADAIRAACILASKGDLLPMSHSHSKMKNRLNTLLHDAGVLA